MHVSTKALLVTLSLGVFASGCGPGPDLAIGRRVDGGTNPRGDGGTNPGGDGGNMQPVDAGPPPAPSAKLVSPNAVTAGLVTNPAGGSALYLASPMPGVAPSEQMPFGTPTNGELHLVTNKGVDSVVTSSATGSVGLGGYTFTPDGKSIVFSVIDATSGFGDLSIAPVATPKAGVEVVPSTSEVVPSSIAGNGFFSDDARYYVFGADDQQLNASESMLVLDTQASPPAIVFDVQDGGYNGHEGIYNGVLYYTTSSGGTTPVWNLYSVVLKGLTKTTKATLIAARVSTFAPSGDGKTLLYITASGDIFSQAIGATGPTGTPTQVTPVSTFPAPPAATQFAVDGGCTTAPCHLAWAGGDGSVHVYSGKTEVYKTAAKTIDPFSSLNFTNDGSLYFFQSVKSQELRGILYYADLSKVTTTATTTVSKPVAVFGTVTGLDDANYDKVSTYLNFVVPLGGGAFLAQQDLPAAMAAFGTPLFTPLVVSGSPVVSIATGVPFGDVSFGANGAALIDTGATDPAKVSRITGAATYAGTLGLTDFTGAAKSVLAKAGDVVAGGNYAWSDDGFDLLFIEQTATAGSPEFSTAAMNYTGTLHVYDVTGGSGDHPVTFTGGPDGVTEIGQVQSRTLFYLATPTTATAQGVYYLTY